MHGDSDNEGLRGRGRAWLALAICLVAAAVALTPGTASARVAAQARFTLRASHGYSADFSANGPGSQILYGKAERPRPSGHGGLSVEVSKGHAAAAYFHPAHFKPKHFSGRLGGLGRVTVSFHRKGKRDVRLPHCSGHIVRRVGVFTGTIRFRGERGYTRVRAHHAHGTVEIPRHLHCRFGGGGHVVHETQLDARTQSGLTDFLASRDRGTSDNFFLGAEAEDKGKLSVTRIAWADAPKPAFTFAPDLSSAHVAPPLPFSGSADFLAPHQWSGSLAVSFPGSADVALTGSGFSASLTRR